MANFQTHVTTSTVLGIGYAGAGFLWGLPLDAALLAGGLCGIGGMLPDIDSASGRPAREILTFAAAGAPLLMMERFSQLGLGHDTMVLIGGLIYLVVRFGGLAFLKRWTVHRGMFHSIPAAIIFAELAFLLCGGGALVPRYFKAGGVLLGVMSHLLLDELYSIEWYRGRFRLKSSFGTAIKFWSKSLWGNVSTYAKLILVTAAVLSDSSVMKRFGAPPHDSIREQASQIIDTLRR